MARVAFTNENEPMFGGKLAQLSLTDENGKILPSQPSNTNTAATKQVLNIFKKPFGNNRLTNVLAPSQPVVSSATVAAAALQQHQRKQQEQQSSAALLISKIPRLRPATTSPIEEIEDIDKYDGRDAIYQVTDFVKDIYAYLRKLEQAQSIEPNFLKHQSVLTPKVRSRLVNWCIDINERLKLLPETLYLSIAIMDRYFQLEHVEQHQVQLVGVTAMFIASKYEEIYAPEANDFIVLCNGEYKKRDILKTEIQILKKLNFDLGRPLPLSFLRRFSKAAHSDIYMHTLAKYLMELSLTEHECAHWKPSLLASTALYVTIKLLDKGNWTRTLAHYTCYAEYQLKPCAAILCKTIKKSQRLGSHLSCVKKYSTSEAKGVPTWPQLKSPMVDELASFVSK